MKKKRIHIPYETITEETEEYRLTLDDKSKEYIKAPLIDLEYFLKRREHLNEKD